jgi:tellurite resistance protein TerC
VPSALPIETWHWLAFGAFVVVVLTLDLTVFHRQSKESSLREAAGWTLVWCSIALVFNALLWFWLGPKTGVEFLTGYLIEWSLSMDNVFVFAVIFSFFRVPLKYQYRVLFWGILGAIIMRLTFILVGSELIRRFDFIMPIFGAFLIYTGIKLVMHDDEQVDPGNNLLMRVARKIFPVASGEHGNHFFVREAGRLCITRLFLVLLVVESTDVMFAVDSVPAIFGITREPFIVFTSNIFAILGLRALYFLLAGVMDMFRYLKYGLSAVLVFVGVKMVAEYAAHVPAVADFISDNVWRGFHVAEGHHLLPPAASLVIVLSLLGISIVASIIAKKREDHKAARDADNAATSVAHTPNAEAEPVDAEPMERSASSGTHEQAT